MSKSLVPVWDLPESTSSAGFFLGGIYLFVQKNFRVEKLLNVAVWLARNLTPWKTRCLKRAGKRGMKKRGEGKSSVGVKNRWSGKSRVDLRKFWKLGLAMGATLRPGNRELRLAEPLTSASAIADFSPPWFKHHVARSDNLADEKSRKFQPQIVKVKRGSPKQPTPS